MIKKPNPPRPAPKPGQPSPNFSFKGFFELKTNLGTFWVCPKRAGFLKKLYYGCTSLPTRKFSPRETPNATSPKFERNAISNPSSLKRGPQPPEPPGQQQIGPGRTPRLPGDPGAADFFPISRPHPISILSFV